MRLGGILKRKKVKQKYVTKFKAEDVQQKCTRYFEQEKGIPQKVTSMQLEQKINGILSRFKGYGNVAIAFEKETDERGGDKLHIYMEEMPKNRQGDYFCRVFRYDWYQSTEELLRQLYINQEINASMMLVDIVCYKKCFKILIFKKL